MSSIDANPSDDERRSAASSSSWTHFGSDRSSASCFRLTFDHPPINTVTATTVVELDQIAAQVGRFDDEPIALQVLRRPSDPAGNSRVASGLGAPRCSRSGLEQLGAGAVKRTGKLVARADPELCEHLAQMPLHGARAEEQPRTDLRIRQPTPSQLSDLPLLCGQIITCLRCPCAPSRRSPVAPYRCGRRTLPSPCH